MKAVKPNKEILYFDLVLGIKETPGGLQFHISSDKMIDFFSIEMKAFFNYLKIILAIITFRLSGKAETRKITSNLVFVLYVSIWAFVIGQKQGQSSMVFKCMTAERNQN